MRATTSPPSRRGAPGYADNRSWWERWLRRGRPRPIVGARPGSARKATGDTLYGPPLFGIPALPPQPPHDDPSGRPIWWNVALPQNRLLYPDDTLNRLIEEMRRTVPMLDRAIVVLVGLLGTVQFDGPKSVAPELTEWAERVKVNQTGRGLLSWLQAHADAMLQYGKGTGEIVPSRQLRDVYALMNLDPRTVVWMVTEDPLFLYPLQRQRFQATLVPLPPDLTLSSVHAGHTDTPHGNSLFRSLPFVARAARIIENATAQAWQRLGSPDFHINWEPPAEFADPDGTLADSVLSDLKTSWNAVMAQKEPETGTVSDYFTAGKVTVTMIGREGAPLSLTETHRTFMEQMVAVTGLPSWMLGFHWSTTERMALQQSEVLVANIESLRRLLDPALELLVDTRQRFAGRRSLHVKHKWSPISLHDATEQARAKAWQEQARQRRISNAVNMWYLGFWDQMQAARDIDPTIEAVARPLAEPPLLPNSGSPVVSPNEGYSGG